MIPTELIFATLPLLTFWFPLFRWGIPNMRHRDALEHQVDVTLTLAQSFSTEPIYINCSTSMSELTAVYKRHNICFPPSMSQAYCPADPQRLQLLQLIDVTYFREGQIFRDVDALNDLPMPFDVNAMERLCTMDWLYDPVSHLFVNNNRPFCSRLAGSEVWESCKEFTTAALLTYVCGSGMGLLLVAQIVSVGLLCVKGSEMLLRVRARGHRFIELE